MRIAVTGGSGFIGSKLVGKLLNGGKKVSILDVATPTGNGEADAITSDIRILKEARASLVGIDTVYHLAGPVLETVRNQPYQGTELSMIGTLNVLEACRTNDIKKIIFASTFYVYDGIDPNTTVDEQSSLNGNGMELFSASKLLCENLVRTYSQKYGLEYVILRFGSAYGAGNCSNIVKTFLEAGIQGRQAVVWGQGLRRNQYTFVDDIAQGCLLAMNEVNEVYNLISPEQTSVKELAGIAEEECKLNVVFDTSRREGASMPYMSSKKAQERLGWKTLGLREGTRRTLNEMTSKTLSVTSPLSRRMQGLQFLQRQKTTRR